MFTLQDFVIAFEKWENDYRVNPTNYYTPDETANQEVSEVSIRRAEHFMDLLTNDGKEKIMENFSKGGK